MRKDVKIGLALAGVLFAVLIVYAFVPKKDTTQTASGDGAGQQQTEGDTADNTAPPADTGAAPTDSGAAPRDAGVASKGAGNDVFDPNFKGTPEADGAAANAAGAGNTDWLKTFDQDKIVSVESHPPLIAQTRTPTPGSAAPPSGGTPVTDVNHGPGGPPIIPNVGDTTGNGGPTTRRSTGGGGGATSAEHAKSGQDRIIADPPPAPAPTKAGGGTHVIQKDETFSTIAKAVYGKQKYAAAIEKANPGVDPRRLKPGTTIVLPDIAAVDRSSDAAKPGSAKSGSGTATPNAARRVDPATEYEVQAGDSLYKISVRLYGNGSHAEELYDNNVKTIGDDPAKLKVGTVLKLHDAPRVKQATR